MHSGDVAKDFAGRMRINDGVIATLVWANRFLGEGDVMGGIAAVVIEEGCPNADVIESCYRQWSPDSEIHYMTPDGQWKKNADEESDQPGQPAAKAEADTTGTVAADDAAEQDDAGSDPGAAGDAAVGAEAGNDIDDGESATDGDAEGEARQDG
jgi:hypothetical protein